nr:unnamed protein product [Callosobruchus analis]
MKVPRAVRLSWLVIIFNNNDNIYFPLRQINLEILLETYSNNRH